MITLTDKSAVKVQEFLAGQAVEADTAGLRVGVRGGGCSGFQYALALDEQRDEDTIFEDKGIRLLVDRPSLPYVKGSVIDFVDGLQGAGFKVENPNVIAACGCGSSFRLADEGGVSAVRCAAGRGGVPDPWTSDRRRVQRAPKKQARQRPIRAPLLGKLHDLRLRRHPVKSVGDHH